MERIKIEDGSVWPDPSGKDFDNLAWRLRYAQNTITQADMFNAAGVMEAYHTLTTHPALTLRKVAVKISGIRKVIKEAYKLNTLAGTTRKVG